MDKLYQLNFRHLTALLAVASAGNISAAAKAVNLSQPALAQAVARIEQIVDAQLFDRRPGGVNATAACISLVARIRQAQLYLLQGVRQARRGSGHAPWTRPDPRLTMSQLRAVVSVVSCGSYSGAAALLGLAQPSLHRAIRELQEIVGIALLERVGKSVRPTLPAGHLVHFVRLMMAELRAGLEEIAASHGGAGGTLRIGVLPVARAYFLPKVLARFCSQWPAASIEIVEGPFAELLGHLRQGELDLLIGSQRAKLPAHDVTQQLLFDDELVIVGRAGHPLQDQAHLSIEALSIQQWVMPAPGTPLRDSWERMFQIQGCLAPAPRVQCGSLTLKRGLMLEDDWLTLMSRDQFRLESQASQLAEIGSPGPGFWRSVALIRRTDWRPTFLQAQFVKQLVATAPAGSTKSQAFRKNEVYTDFRS